MSRWRKKPVVIEAFRWTGGPDQTEDPEWIVEAIVARAVRINDRGTPGEHMAIDTLEGQMTAAPGDYIIRGVEGEIYPCKPGIFEKTYEAALPAGAGGQAIHLNERERATILAALRLRQADLESSSGGPIEVEAGDFDNIATNFEAFDSLDTVEIDDLCERINA